jgi:hypothetical protein
LKLKQDLPCIRALNPSDMRSRRLGNMYRHEVITHVPLL